MDAAWRRWVLYVVLFAACGERDGNAGDTKRSPAPIGGGVGTALGMQAARNQKRDASVELGAGIDDPAVVARLAGSGELDLPPELMGPAAAAAGPEGAPVPGSITAGKPSVAPAPEVTPEEREQTLERSRLTVALPCDPVMGLPTEPNGVCELQRTAVESTATTIRLRAIVQAWNMPDRNRLESIALATMVEMHRVDARTWRCAPPMPVEQPMSYTGPGSIRLEIRTVEHVCRDCAAGPNQASPMCAEVAARLLRGDEEASEDR